MIFYKTEAVAGYASEERTTDILTGTVEEPKFVRKLMFTEYTATENMDALIRVFKNTVKIAEIPLYHFFAVFDAATKIAMAEIELDIELATGDKLEVGHLSGGTASNIRYTVVYEIGRGVGGR